MVSSDAVVESDRAEHSIALEESATAFNTRAESRGWVSEDGGLFDTLRKVFMSDNTDGDAAGTYAERVGASVAPVTDVYEKIADDAEAATQAFEDVQQVADRLLKTGDCSRADLINFETAMVTAQKSYRGFSEAAGIAAGRDSAGIEGAEAALQMLASTIDTARETADALADAYATPAFERDEESASS